MYKELQILQMSEILHDLTVIRDRAVTIDQVKDDYDRENVVCVGNKMFDLEIPDVKDINSPDYVNEGEIIEKMVKLVRG